MWLVRFFVFFLNWRLLFFENTGISRTHEHFRKLVTCSKWEVNSFISNFSIYFVLISLPRRVWCHWRAERKNIKGNVFLHKCHYNSRSTLQRSSILTNISNTFGYGVFGSRHRRQNVDKKYFKPVFNYLDQVWFIHT